MKKIISMMHGQLVVAALVVRLILHAFARLTPRNGDFEISRERDSHVVKEDIKVSQCCVPPAIYLTPAARSVDAETREVTPA